MSRTSTGRPEHRLHFAYPYLEIERVGAPPRRVPLDAGDPAPELRRFGAEIARRRGRLTAVLPEAEVWRGRVAAVEGDAVARRAAGEALAAPPSSLRVVLGPVGADGLRAAAAVRRATLAEARAFLARAGLRPTAFSAAGAFPGFPAPPAFGRFAAAVARFEARRVLDRFALPAVLGSFGPSGSRAGRAAAAGAGLAALLAVLAWVGPWIAAAPTLDRTVPPPALASRLAAVDAPSKSSPPPAAPLAPPPLARPAELPRFSAAAVPAATRPELVPVVLASRGMSPEIAASGASRPASGGAPQTPADPPLRAAEVAPVATLPPLRREAPTAAAGRSDASAATPEPAAQPAPAAAALDAAVRPRPRPAAAAAPEASDRAAALAPEPRDDRPRARPVAPGPGPLAATLAATIAAAPAVPSGPVSGGPRARPADLAPAAQALAAAEPVDVAPIVLAALTPPITDAGLAAAGAGAPAPRPAASVQPARPAAAAPQAPRAERTRVQPQAVQPAPQPVRAAAVAPVQQPARAVRQPAAPTVRVQPAPVPQPARVRTVRLEAPAAPARQARQPTAAPQRVQPARAQPAPAPVQAPAGVARPSALALVGVFGSANRRHALVQLPNGQTQRVRPGDEVQGVQVTAIAADGVHLRAQGRDSVLRLPD